MSEQPCLWVVEKKDGDEWLFSGVHYVEWAAKSSVQSWRAWSPSQQFRVAKYVRVEPAKKKRSKP